MCVCLHVHEKARYSDRQKKWLPNEIHHGDSSHVFGRLQMRSGHVLVLGFPPAPSAISPYPIIPSSPSPQRHPRQQPRQDRVLEQLTHEYPITEEGKELTHTRVHARTLCDVISRASCCDSGLRFDDKHGSDQSCVESPSLSHLLTPFASRPKFDVGDPGR